MMERYTLGGMLRYFKEAKDAGADKEGRNAMAMALIYAGQELGLSTQLTSTLGSFRQSIPNRA